MNTIPWWAWPVLAAVLAPPAGVLVMFEHGRRRGPFDPDARILADGPAAEPGPPDGFRDPLLDEIPPGPAWRDHLTHTRLDEESPRLLIRRTEDPE